MVGMAMVMLRLLTNVYGYFVVYVFVASWLGYFGLVYLPFHLSLDPSLGVLILSALALAPTAGKYRIKSRPDRLGALVLAFALFEFYLAIAIFLRFSGLVSLPLGTLDSVVFSVLVAVYIPPLALWAIRQKRRSQTSPKSA